MTFFNYLKRTFRVNHGLSNLSIPSHWKIYTEWRKQVESGKTPLDFELPWITVIAKNYLKNYLKKKQKSELKILEFGAGGSTLFFLKYASEVVSVEHNAEWFELVSKQVEKNQIKGWQGHLIKPESRSDSPKLDLDPSNPAHYSTADESLANFSFEKYASSVDAFSNNYFDVILVDGRSRPSCISHSLSKIKKGGLLVLDNAEREYYLSNNLIDKSKFRLEISAYDALICYDGFTQTNIYLRIV